MIRVILAEDHALVRAGLRAILESTGGVTVLAEVADGQAAVDAVRALSPDVAVLDVSMPGLSGLEALRHIVAESPQTRCLMLSAHRTGEYVTEALRLGAGGYVLKSADVVEFGLALRAVARGESYVSRVLRARAGDPPHTQSEELRDGPVALTPRQHDVLRLVASGASTKRVAAELNLSPKTVEAHRSQLMERLGIHDVAGLVRYAVRHGLIDSEPK